MAEQEWPQFLESYAALVQHVRAALEGLNTAAKGQRFARLVGRAIPLWDATGRFGSPVLSQRQSHDDGVDLIASGDTARLLVQAKLHLDRADDIDSVISKFSAYVSSRKEDSSGQGLLALQDPSTEFAIVTLSRLPGVLKAYESKAYASRAAYGEWRRRDVVHVLDGDVLLRILRLAHQKLGERPPVFELSFATDLIRSGDVRVGVVSSDELKRLYEAFGDALFFENIRDFLGGTEGRDRSGRSTPNAEIVRTVEDAPDQMIARNNGIVFGAAKVEEVGPRRLRLTHGSVLNGCQTTVCIVRHASAPTEVVAKVVQTSESWDIAKAANYQNHVADIDLDLARHLRPQLARRAATSAGVTLGAHTVSVFQVIDELYDRRIAYEETRLLFVGVFSRTPNNVFRGSYADLRGDIIDALYKEDPYGENVFTALFGLQALGGEALERARARLTHDSYAPFFQRVFKEDKPGYRVYISILALCGQLELDLTERRTSRARTSPEFDGCSSISAV